MQLKLSCCQHARGWYKHKMLYESLMVITKQKHRYINDKEKGSKHNIIKNSSIYKKDNKKKKILKLQNISEIN